MHNGTLKNAKKKVVPKAYLNVRPEKKISCASFLKNSQQLPCRIFSPKKGKGVGGALVVGTTHSRGVTQVRFRHLFNASTPSPEQTVAAVFGHKNGGFVLELE